MIWIKVFFFLAFAIIIGTFVAIGIMKIKRNL